MRLLIECSHVYEHPHVHTGIQRVVRNVIASLTPATDPAPDGTASAPCIPVIMRGMQLRRVSKLIPDTIHISRLAPLERILGLWIRLCWMLHAKVEAAVSLPGPLSKGWWWCCRLLSAPAGVGVLALTRFRYRWFDDGRSEPMTLQRGDVLVLLDSSWGMKDRPLVNACRSLGVQVVAVVYDLIPLTHPQFWGPGLAHAFADWFEWISTRADGYMAISGTVCEQVRTMVLAKRSPSSPLPAPWFDYFHLGTELDRKKIDAEPDPALVAFFSERPVYLMVSTIEPRKNHVYLLDAFDLLWAAGVDVSLCFIGKNGWKNENLLKRIDGHPELGARLRIFNTAPDADLEYAYGHARALVFSSIAEGFGLPLVEAMQRGLPAMVSDIPVFREIGQDYAAYFDLASPQSLADMVQEFEHRGQFPAAAPLDSWNWLDWRGATAQLITRVLAHSHNKNSSLLPETTHSS